MKFITLLLLLSVSMLLTGCPEPPAPRPIPKAAKDTPVPPEDNTSEPGVIVEWVDSYREKMERARGVQDIMDQRTRQLDRQIEEK